MLGFVGGGGASFHVSVWILSFFEQNPRRVDFPGISLLAFFHNYNAFGQKQERTKKMHKNTFVVNI
jgi:hypothetical protein